MIIQALEAMAQGMLGIFVVMGLIIGTIQLLGKMGKKAK
jgi:Oxaloacetate decarboxylase, gamma chain.